MTVEGRVHRMGKTLDRRLQASGRAPQNGDAPRRIGDIITLHAMSHPDAPALIGYGGLTLTYRDLRDAIGGLSSQLQSLGVQRGDRLGLLVPPGLPAGVLCLGVACTATLVPINPQLTLPELHDLVGNFELDAILVPDWIDHAPLMGLAQNGCAILNASMTSASQFTLSCATDVSQNRRPDHAMGDDNALLLRSSGTTGRPKIVAVTNGNLIAMAERLASPRWFGLTENDRVACTLPLHYAAGAKTSLFVPVLLGGSVCFPPAGRGHAIPEWIDELKPTFLSVAPPALNAMVQHLRHQPHAPAHQLRFIISAASYLPPQLGREARDLLGVPVLEYYALSEAGVMAANPIPPGVCKPGTVGAPMPGELTLLGADLQPVANGEVGQIMISGPCVTPGYANADAHGAWVEGGLLTGDLGRLDEDGYLTIVGRVVEVINRGGEKVFPYEIERALIAYPGVREAAVFGTPHPTLGENVAAAIVAEPEAEITAQEIRQWLALRLVPFKVPSRIHLVDELPRVNGKISRQQLREQTLPRREEARLPDSIIEFEVLAIWQRLLGRESIGLDEHFFDAGGDSLLASEMLIEIEEFIGQTYPVSELAILTIRHIAEVILSGVKDHRQFLLKIRDGQGEPLFYCHGDYLNRGLYARKLFQSIEGDRPIYLLHTSADLHLGMTVEDVASSYEREIMAELDGRPIIVAGYCHGGLVAWRVVQMLRRRGVNVRTLILIEMPTINWRAPARAAVRLMSAAGRVLPGKIGRFLRVDGGRALWYRLRGHAGLRTMVYGYLRRRMVKVQSGDRTLSVEVEAVHRSYLRMISRYLPGAIDVPVTTIVASGGRAFDTDTEFLKSYTPQLEVLHMPGTHLGSITVEREALIGLLNKILTRSQPPSSGSSPSR